MPSSNVRRTIVGLVFIVYWLLIFEGALRKWAFPEFHRVLFFIRDPFVLAIYVLALRHRFIPKGPFWEVSIVMAIVLAALTTFQLVIIESSPLVILYGLRNYIFYIPLAFIIGQSFRAQDLQRLFRQTLLVAVPISVLVYFQFTSAPTAFINQTFSENAFIFLVVKDIVRTTGTFTFTAGQTFFVASILAMLAAVWIMPKKLRPLNGLPLHLATGAGLSMLLLSGSRSAFVFALLTLSGVFIAGFLSRRPLLHWKAIALPSAAMLLAGFIAVQVFPTALEAMTLRQEQAFRSEGSMIARIQRDFTSFIPFVASAPALGYGLGVGTGGGSTVATGEAQFTLAENEWSRIILEAGPYVGLLFMFYRLLLFSWLGLAALGRARDGDAKPLLLFSFIGVVLLNGAITMQGTINGYGWLFTGFVMAAIRAGATEEQTPFGAES